MFIAVEFIYSVVLISAVHRVTQFYICMFFFIFFSIMFYHRRLNIVLI